jgi:UDP-3-O-[3-hydroxymyristoyl] glucosamine N-acyltransferase
MPVAGLTLAELAAAVKDSSAGRLEAVIDGPSDRLIRGAATLAEAGAGELAFLANPRYRADAAATRAAAVVLSPADFEALSGGAAASAARPSFVLTRNPYAWFALALQRLHPEPAPRGGVHASAVVAPDARLAAGVSVGPGAVIESGARLEEGAVIGALSFVGAGARVGAGSRLHAHVTLAHGCELGQRCVVHSGAVIGADGFGFAPFEGGWIKIPQVGRVLIGDAVEIGANTSIDRGALGDTVIEDEVKLDNQIQIGHNCRIGRATVMAGCVGVAGSATIGRGCQIGGAAMIAGHLTIADGCAIGPGTLVASSIAEPGHYTGFFPMMKNRDWERSAAIIRHLDELRRRVRELERGARKDTP